MRVPRDLNSIDWASLTHAYGSAEDVPGLLSDLRSADAEVRNEARYELNGNIFHQGTRYEASAYAVPFLLELAADPTTPDRHEVISLLTGLATGYGHDATTGFPIAAMRDAMAQVPDQTWHSWSQAMKEWYAVVSTGQRQPLPLAKAERRLLETRHGLAAYDAVRAGIPVLLDCLTDLDTEVAGEAVDTLACFPEEFTSIRPGLMAIARDDQRPVQLAGAALVAIGLLGGPCTPSVADLLDTHLRGADPHLSWSAAVAWAHLAGGDAPDSVVAELCTWAAVEGQDAGRTVWGARRGDLSSQMLARIAEPAAEEVDG
jgi:hypothetical protein